MELKPFLHEATIALEDDFNLILAVDYASIAYLEGLHDKGIHQLFGELASSMTLMTQFLFALTRKHHSDLSHDVIAGIQYSEKYGQVVVAALGKLMRDVFRLDRVQEPPPAPKAAKQRKKEPVSG